MDDWQDEALSSRHFHNRGSRRDGAGSGKGKGAFDVRRTFGTFEVKCPAAEKLLSASTSGGSAAKLEVYGLDDNQNALFAELVLPGVLEAVVVLAGSRKIMNQVLKDLQEDIDPEKPTTEHKSSEQTEPRDVDKSDNSPQDTENEEPAENRRAKQFEKNSFRSPKFWLKWQGRILHGSKPNEGEAEELTTDSGYLIFSGNSCDKFQGTLSCEKLGWDNVKLQGWKVSAKSQRDFRLTWQI